MGSQVSETSMMEYKLDDEKHRSGDVPAIRKKRYNNGIYQTKRSARKHAKDITLIKHNTPSVPTKLGQNFWARRLRNCVEWIKIKINRIGERKIVGEIKE